MIPRSEIERVKRELAQALDSRKDTFHRAILREVEYLWFRARQSGLSFEQFIDRFAKMSVIPPSVKLPVIDMLREAESQIAEIWMEYFDTMLPDAWSALDLDRMHALYRVDFPRINEQARSAIVGEMRRMARARAGFDALRHRLEERNLGETQSATLANTALAQFDNATMHELSAQAGLTKFLYDGVIHPNSRKFCVERVGKVFTLERIRAMDNLQGIPVETSLGGYNCTHWWTPVESEPKKSKKVVVPSTSTAAGKPVSEALDVRLTGRLKESTDRALSLIDRVHGDGDLTRIPIKRSSSRRTAGAFYFRGGTNHGPVEIKVSTSSSHPTMTALHEIGHFIDHDGIGQKGSKESLRPDADMRRVLEAAAGSKTIQLMASTMPFSLRRYYLSPEEIWARAYSQYIIEKSADPVAVTELKAVTDGTQWDQEDFRPIAEAIDELFINQGWIKK